MNTSFKIAVCVREREKVCGGGVNLFFMSSHTDDSVKTKSFQIFPVSITDTFPDVFIGCKGDVLHKNLCYLCYHLKSAFMEQVEIWIKASEECSENARWCNAGISLPTAYLCCLLQ